MSTTTTPTISDAAKAAALLHHTWGIPDAKAAVGLFDMLNSSADCDEFTRLLDCQDVFVFNWGIHPYYENLSASDLWQEVCMLARSIDGCREELGS